MRYVGPVEWKLRDGQHSDLRPYARKLLGQLEYRRQLGGIQDVYTRHTLPDGRRIRASIVGKIYQVFIDGGEDEKGTEGCEGYMDSGYLVAGATDYTYDPSDGFVAAPSPQYLSPRLLELYSTAEDMGYEPARDEAAGNGAFPRAFSIDEESEDDEEVQLAKLWEKTTNHLFVPGMAGQNSGKSKLYAQARLGRELAAYDRPFVNGWGASWSTRGLFTDADGEYWIVTISESGFGDSAKLQATFSLLNVPECHRGKLEAAESDDEELIAEAYALAYSFDGDESYTVDIEFGDYLDWKDAMPYFGSWAFNWDGSEAAMVVHRTDGSNADASLNVLSWKMSISSTELRMYLRHHYNESKDRHEFRVSVSPQKVHRWTFHNSYDFFWVPSLNSARGLIYCPVGAVAHADGLQWDVQPNDVPLYVYYGSDVPADAGTGGHKTTERQLVTYTRRENQGSTESGSNCAGNHAYIWCSGWVLKYKYQYSNDYHFWQYKINGTVMSETRRTSGYNWESKTINWSAQDIGPYETFSGNLSTASITDKVCGATCDGDPQLLDCRDLYPNCPTNPMTIRHRNHRVHRSYAVLTGSFIESASGCAMIFPINCREGITFVANREQLFALVTINTVQTVPSGWNAYREIIGITCGCDGEVYSANFGVEGITEPLSGGATELLDSYYGDYWIFEGEWTFVGRNPQDAHVQQYAANSKTGSLKNHFPIFKFAFRSSIDPCVEDWVAISQGMQDAWYVTGGGDVWTLNDMPKELEDPPRHGIIGYA